MRELALERCLLRLAHVCALILLASSNMYKKSARLPQPLVDELRTLGYEPSISVY